MPTKLDTIIARRADGAPMVPDGSCCRLVRHQERNVHGSLRERSKVMENVARVPVVVTGFRTDPPTPADHPSALTP